MRVFVVSGYSGTGKTTLIEEIIRTLTKSGQSVATLKSSMHEAGPEQGTDTWRHRQAGASMTIFLGPARKSAKFKDMISSKDLSRLSKFDFLIVEGLKSVDIPRFWCVGNREIEPSDVPKNTQAIVSWSKKEDTIVEDICVIEASEIDLLVDIVKKKSVDISEID